MARITAANQDQLRMRSLSPLSVGPIPSPISPEQEEIAQETFDKLYRDMKDSGEIESTRNSSHLVTPVPNISTNTFNHNECKQNKDSIQSNED